MAHRARARAMGAQCGVRTKRGRQGSGWRIYIRMHACGARYRPAPRSPTQKRFCHEKAVPRADGRRRDGAVELTLGLAFGMELLHNSRHLDLRAQAQSAHSDTHQHTDRARISARNAIGDWDCASYIVRACDGYGAALASSCCPNAKTALFNHM